MYLTDPPRESTGFITPEVTLLPSTEHNWAIILSRAPDYTVSTSLLAHFPGCFHPAYIDDAGQTASIEVLLFPCALHLWTTLRLKANAMIIVNGNLLVGLTTLCYM